MYYKLIQTPVMEGLYMTRSPELGMGVDWLSAIRHTDEVPAPLEVELDPVFGTILPDLLDDSLLLMSDQMVEAIRRAGVDNIDTYDAVLIDRENSRRFENYKVVQIIGRIAAADMGESDVFDPENIGHTVVQFRKLVVDESKITNALMFRLHENISTILIHDRVKQELEQLNLNFVSIVPPDENPAPVTEKNYEYYEAEQ